MLKLQELIARLEAARGPDRGLDGMICRDVLGWLPYFDLDGDKIIEWDDFGGHWHLPNDPCDGRHPVSEARNPDPPEFTTSIDAALTLVPEGFYVRKFSQWSDGWYCTVIRAGENYSGEQKPPALALCIAALKARATLASPHPTSDPVPALTEEQMRGDDE